jgi:hypothetical protein
MALLTNEKFAAMKIMADADVKMGDTLTEIAKKNSELPGLIQKWTKYYTRQNYEVTMLEIALDESYGELYRDKKFNDNVDWGTSSKGIDSQIRCDKGYCEKLRQLAAQKYYLNFISETLANLKQMHYTIKNFNDYKKITTTNL